MRRGIRGGRSARNDAMPAMRDDIQDLDRELELLRRKRQLIEEQQRQFQPTQQYQQPQKFNRGHVISPWEQQPALRSNDFNQPRTSYNQNEFEFSNLYNSGQSNSGNGFGAGPRNRKRQFNGPRWQDETAGPKRFRDNRSNTGGNFNPPKKFTPKPKPFQGGGGPQVSAPPQNKSAPKPFNKKKPFTKPNEKPAAGRPNKPLPSTAPTDAPNKAVEDNRASLEYVIKDDDHRKYPKKVQGRIQFATGIIYKNLIGRLDKGSKAHTLYRHIKPILYSRIHKAMLNKAVGNVQNIIDLYDAAFPPTTDDELVDQAAAKEAERVKAIQPALDKPESDNVDSRKTAEGPKDYFKNNITDIMKKKLSEMINKLKQTYENEYNLQETAQDGENVNADKTTGDTDTSAAAASADAETGPESNNDGKTEPADVENAATDENKPADEEKATTEAPGNAEGDNTTLENTKNAEGENGTTEEPKNDEGNNAEDTKNLKYNKRNYFKNVENYHVTQVNELVKREMWRMLTMVKDDLIAIMNMDKEFVNAKLSIAENADRMRRELMNTPLHYVVLAGIPRLPKKAKLKTFLRHFHPNAIKKHRTVRNVLFIGFANPQDQANILKANNTIFENAKLSIKETKNIGNAADNKEEKTETEENDMTAEDAQELDDSQTDGAEDSFKTEDEQNQDANENSDKVLDSDLDGEINDLLASINESETNPEDASEDVEMNDNDENDAPNDGEEAEGGDADENQDGNEVINLDDEQEGEGSGDAVVEDANGEENPAENKDGKPEATGAKGAVKKVAVATPKRASTRVAAGAVQTRRSSRLPN